MKKLFLLIFLAVSQITIAQLPGMILIDSTSIWRFSGESWYQEFAHCNQQFAVQISRIAYFFDGDTSIAGNDYLKMYQIRIDSNYCNSNPSVTWSDTSFSFRTYMREDNNQLFLYDEFSSSDVLFRAYNINIGDSLSPNCTIGSIDTLYLHNQPYRKFNCDCNADYLIEAVGTKRHLFANLECGIGIEGDWHNTCYEKNGFVIQIDTARICAETGDPSLFTSVSRNYENDDIKVLPNPIQDLVFINFETPKTGIIELISMDGKVQYAETFSDSEVIKIDISHLPSAIYYGVIRLNDNVLKRVKLSKN